MNRIPGLRIIGLTGPSGAGKGMVAALFRSHGIPTVDTDAVWHSLLVPPSPAIDALRDLFGESVIRPDGTPDRQAIAAIVFAPTAQGREKLQRLDTVSHRLISNRCETIFEQYAADGCKIAVLDAPLLIEAGLTDVCDRVVAVLADRETRINRLVARDAKTPEEIRARLDAQPDDGFYAAHADDLLYNNSDIDELIPAVDRIVAGTEGRA